MRPAWPKVITARLPQGAMAARAGTTSPLSLARRAVPSASAGGAGRAPGLGRAVAAHLAGDQPGWHATVEEVAASRAAGQEATLTRTQPASPRGTTGRTGGVAGDLSPEGSGRNAGSNKRRFGNCKRCPGQPKPPAQRLQACPPRRALAPSTARGTDVHKQDRRDRTIPAAVIVVVFFVAILVAALIWLAAS